MKKVYLDYAASTPVLPAVVSAMAPYWEEKFGNPSSIHSWGEEARIAVDRAREKIASALGVSPEEIFFTGTVTTSTNLAIQGAAKARGKGKVITSMIEHHAVLDTVKALGEKGFASEFIPVDRNGVVDLEALGKAIDEETILVSIMYANNEVGTIQPIKEIAGLIREKEKKLGAKILFHVDIAPAVGWLPVNLKKLDLDLASGGAHKFGGPKGVGFLYRRQGVSLTPLTFGGHQEGSLWPGTEAVPLIVGMAEALRVAVSAKAKKRVEGLRDYLIEGMRKVPGVELTGHPQKRLADIASFIVTGVEGEAMLFLLSEAGIAASSGSACTSGELLKPSHVLLAMGIAPEKAHGSIRFSLSPETTKEEIDYLLKIFPGIVAQLRRLRRGIG